MATTRSTRARSATGDNMKPVLSIDIDKNEEDTLPVRLVGQIYKVSRPKGALALKMASYASQMGGDEPSPEALQELMSTMDTLITAVFQDQADAVRARLYDPNDRLDMEHVQDLFDKLPEAFTGNPRS